MAWLVGLIVAILALIFWRVSLVLVGIVIVGGIIIWQLDEADQARKQAEAIEAARQRREIIQNARATASPKNWEVFYNDDPASGNRVARTASIRSDDGLCVLSVQLRINGNELTGISCPYFEFYVYDDLDVKFSGDQSSTSMDLRHYDGQYGKQSSVYIPSSGQYGLDYDDFIQRLRDRDAVAIKLHGVDQWVRFSLSNSAEAIDKLGSTLPSPTDVP